MKRTGICEEEHAADVRSRKARWASSSSSANVLAGQFASWDLHVSVVAWLGPNLIPNENDCCRKKVHNIRTRCTMRIILSLISPLFPFASTGTYRTERAVNDSWEWANKPTSQHGAILKVHSPSPIRTGSAWRRRRSSPMTRDACSKSPSSGHPDGSRSPRRRSGRP